MLRKICVCRAANEEKNKYTPTLVEVPWPEINLPVANMATVPFSKKGSTKRHHVTLISVTGLDVDSRGRLWILDAPDEDGYWPRIVIYDLKRNDRLVSSTKLINVSPKHLKTLVIDPLEDQWRYIADAGDEMIVVYCLGQDKWWKLRMTHGPEIPRVYSTDLAISRKNAILYMTGHNTHDLFSINLENIRTDQIFQKVPSYSVYNITVGWLGKKLGSSVGLFCDLKDGLHYFLTSDRASVRWDTKSPLSAESHSILIQSNDIPCITDYVIDAQKYIWGLVNFDCFDIKSNVSEKFNLRFRTARIPKYPLAL